MCFVTAVLREALESMIKKFLFQLALGSLGKNKYKEELVLETICLSHYVEKVRDHETLRSKLIQVKFLAVLWNRTRNCRNRNFLTSGTGTVTC